MELDVGVGSSYPVEYLALSSGEFSVGAGRVGFAGTFVDDDADMVNVENA